MVHERPHIRSQTQSNKRKRSQSPEHSAPKRPPALIPTKLV